MQNIKRNGGNIDEENITIKVQSPVAIKFEKSFEGQYPVKKIPVQWSANKDKISFDFEGTAFVLRGDASR